MSSSARPEPTGVRRLRRLRAGAAAVVLRGVRGTHAGRAVDLVAMELAAQLHAAGIRLPAGALQLHAQDISSMTSAAVTPAPGSGPGGQA